MGEILPPRESRLWADWVIFLRAYKAVTERISQEMADNNLPTLVEYSVLYWLVNAEHHRLRQVDLSRGVLVSKSRVTRLMHSLVDQGFVRREKTHADKRVTYAILTDRGQAAYDNATPVFSAAFSQFFANHIAPPDHGEVARILLPMAEQTEGIHDVED